MYDESHVGYPVLPISYMSLWGIGEGGELLRGTHSLVQWFSDCSSWESWHSLKAYLCFSVKCWPSNSASRCCPESLSWPMRAAKSCSLSQFSQNSVVRISAASTKKALPLIFLLPDFITNFVWTCEASLFQVSYWCALLGFVAQPYLDMYWGLNMGFSACRVSALPLSHGPSLTPLLLM